MNRIPFRHLALLCLALAACAPRPIADRPMPLDCALDRGPFAAGAAWYEDNEPIPQTVAPHEDARGAYVKFGAPRVVAADSLAAAARHEGVAVYAEPDDAPPGYDVLYIPVRHGCWFQRYQFEGVGTVRGR